MATFTVDPRAYHLPIRADVARRFAAFQAKATAPPPKDKKRLLLLSGGDVRNVFDTDGEDLLRQEAFFHHLFGVREEGFYGALDLATGQAALFAPRLPESFGVWFGKLHAPDYFAARYACEHAAYRDELPSWLAAQKPDELHVLAGKNSDSGLDSSILAPPDAEELAQGCGATLVRGGAAWEALVESRVHKTPAEVALLEHVSLAAADAHVAMMRECAARSKAAEGDDQTEIMREYELEALFQYRTYARFGCRHQGYTPIVASGANAAILHYGHAGCPNDGPVKRGDLVLADCGAELYRMTSDVTCTWPSSGKFTEDQKLVYEAVLSARDAVLEAASPGVSWVSMHSEAYRRILSALKAGGLVQGEVEEMLEAEVGGLFMPHGLGHLLGLSTHDVGGYSDAAADERAGGALVPRPARVDRPGYRSLRMARALEAGMVVTVEPGCYFNFEALLDPVLGEVAAEGEAREGEVGQKRGREDDDDGKEAAAALALRRRQARFLVPEALERFRGFGGVRIEDNVLITEDRCRSLTGRMVPRTCAEIEATMAGAPWAPLEEALAAVAAGKQQQNKGSA